MSHQHAALKKLNIANTSPNPDLRELRKVKVEKLGRRNPEEGAGGGWSPGGHEERGRRSSR